MKKEVFSESEISASVDRAFRQLDKERQQREQARKSCAQAARDRMIRRQTTDKPNSKEKPSGTEKVQLWSNYR